MRKKVAIDKASRVLHTHLETIYRLTAVSCGLAGTDYLYPLDIPRFVVLLVIAALFCALAEWQASEGRVGNGDLYRRTTGSFFALVLASMLEPLLLHASLGEFGLSFTYAVAIVLTLVIRQIVARYHHIRFRGSVVEVTMTAAIAGGLLDHAKLAGDSQGAAVIWGYLALIFIVFLLAEAHYDLWRDTPTLLLTAGTDFTTTVVNGMSVFVLTSVLEGHWHHALLFVGVGLQSLAATYVVGRVKPETRNRVAHLGS